MKQSAPILSMHYQATLIAVHLILNYLMIYLSQECIRVTQSVPTVLIAQGVAGTIVPIFFTTRWARGALEDVYPENLSLPNRQAVIGMLGPAGLFSLQLVLKQMVLSTSGISNMELMSGWSIPVSQILQYFVFGIGPNFLSLISSALYLLTFTIGAMLVSPVAFWYSFFSGCINSGRTITTKITYSFIEGIFPGHHQFYNSMALTSIMALYLSFYGWEYFIEHLTGLLSTYKPWLLTLVSTCDSILILLLMRALEPLSFHVVTQTDSLFTIFVDLIGVTDLLGGPKRYHGPVSFLAFAAKMSAVLVYIFSRTRSSQENLVMGDYQDLEALETTPSIGLSISFRSVSQRSSHHLNLSEFDVEPTTPATAAGEHSLLSRRWSKNHFS